MHGRKICHPLCSPLDRKEGPPCLLHTTDTHSPTPLSSALSQSTFSSTSPIHDEQCPGSHCTHLATHGSAFISTADTCTGGTGIPGHRAEQPCWGLAISQPHKTLQQPLLHHVIRCGYGVALELSTNGCLEELSLEWKHKTQERSWGGGLLFIQSSQTAKNKCVLTPVCPFLWEQNWCLFPLCLQISQTWLSRPWVPEGSKNPQTPFWVGKHPSQACGLALSFSLHPSLLLTTPVPQTQEDSA